MKNCPNCNSKIGNTLLSGKNELIDEVLLKQLKEFLPPDFVRDNYCNKCIQQRGKDFELVTKYEVYLKSKVSNPYLKKINSLKKSIRQENKVVFVDEEKNILQKFSKNVLVYSVVPHGFELLEFVESFVIVDTGMWSTNSDNFDGVTALIHDRLANKGLDSDNKLMKGFLKAKELIKEEVVRLDGNVLLDFKHTFSDLAGNGKILIYSQGTAAVDNSKHVFSYNNFKQKHKLKIESLEQEIKQLEEYLKEKNVDMLKRILTYSH